MQVIKRTLCELITFSLIWILCGMILDIAEAGRPASMTMGVIAAWLADLAMTWANAGKERGKL